MSDQRQLRTTGRIGWLIVLGVGGLLFAYGALWYVIGPGLALENVAERTPLAADAFRDGSPSALDVISIVTRQGAAFMAGLGLASFLLAWHAIRGGSRAAWRVAWSLPLAIAAFGVSFALVPGAAPQGAAYLGVAALAAVGLALARPGTAT